MSTTDYSHDKTSWMRFGDDLCGLVLSYLTFEDKYRLETVCRQFKRCVHQKHIHLSINNPLGKKLMSTYRSRKRSGRRYGWNHEDMDLTAFERLLKKCAFIESIDVLKIFSNQTDMLSAVMRNCHHLNELELDLKNLSDETISAFFAKFGPKLKAITFRPLYDSFAKSHLKLCSNIKHINILNFKDLSLIIDEHNDIVFKKLTKIKCRFTEEDVPRIKTLVKYNINSLQSAFIDISYGCPQTSVHNLIEELIKLRQLKALSLIWSKGIEMDATVIDLFIQMATECNQLKSLCLEVYITSGVQIDEILSIMQLFPRLKRLDLRLNQKMSQYLDVSFEPLKGCPHLTHLALNCHYISNGFIADISTHLPKLQHLSLFQIESRDIEFIFKCLVQLPKLQSLHLDSYRDTLYCRHFPVSFKIKNERNVDFIGKFLKLRHCYLFGTDYKL